jgi:hypothetical protein
MTQLYNGMNRQVSINDRSSRSFFQRDTAARQKARKGDSNIRLHDEDSTPRRVSHMARSSGCHVEQL